MSRPKGPCTLAFSDRLLAGNTTAVGVFRAEFLDFQMRDLSENLFELPQGVRIIELGV
jgi:hypothetical protein